MSDVIVRKVEATSRTWREEAERRRRISKLDPVAETLEYCAGELATVLKMTTTEHDYFTVEQFAAKEKVTPQTVRAWIRTDQLAAKWGAHGYQIPKDATRTLRTVRPRKVG